ncbi:hypothetical protein [Gulosibacter molinativorax]|uniref:EcsC family protein n=1 Tax=Gulosibacter molinativorax TaxID=256821 RepID=A0ABT7C687_9MICO|nr:hypothetical protein [Gulosibacter molinativorax]MDJ1370618.1 hypothetical protein [Gulosibacter molinativorax]QUY61968.1 Hypotetical protein [Gulosibacter molinativorax]
MKIKATPLTAEQLREEAAKALAAEQRAMLNQGEDAFVDGAPTRDFLMRSLDKILVAQRPTAISFVRRMRRKAPHAAPADLIRATDNWYRRTAMGTGGGVGAAAAIPGVGTAASVAIVSAEVVSFLELTALYALALAEIHGDATEDPDRSRTLVMAVMMGERGQKLVQEFIGKRGPVSLVGSKFWGELVTQAMPQLLVNELGGKLANDFLKQYTSKQVAGTVGKLLPLGIGVAMGLFANRGLANEVIATARTAFGPAPATFVGDLSDASLTVADVERQLRKLEKKIKRKELRSKPRRREITK